MLALTFAGPGELGWLQLASVRAGVALLLFFRWMSPPPVRSQPHPVGLARFVTLTFVGEPTCWRWLQRGVWAALLAYVVGVGLPIVSLSLALYTIAVGGLRFSQGGVGHAWQGTALVLLAQAAALLRFGMEEGLWTGWPSPDALAAQRVALFWCQQALVSVYLTSAVTKLVRSRWEWAWRSARLPLQIVKAAEQQFHEALAARGRDRQVALATRLAARPGLTRAAATLGLAVEVASPLFLIHPRLTFAGGVLLILFHRITEAVMGHQFGQLQALALILMANPALLV